MNAYNNGDVPDGEELQEGTQSHHHQQEEQSAPKEQLHSVEHSRGNGNGTETSLSAPSVASSSSDTYQQSTTLETVHGAEEEEEDDDDEEDVWEGKQSHPPADAGKRAVVYRLREDGQWQKFSEGNIFLISKLKKNKRSHHNKSSDSQGGSKGKRVRKIIARSVEDNTIFFKISADHEELYRRQDATILTVEDPKTKTEYALSFQYEESCSAIWDALNYGTGNNSSDSGADDSSHSPLDIHVDHTSVEEEFFHTHEENGTEFLGNSLGADQSPGRESTNTDTASMTYEPSMGRSLPKPTMDLQVLNEIADTLEQADQFAAFRDKALKTVRQNGYQYLDDLGKTMEQIEQQGDNDSLLAMHRIVKGLVLLNDAKLHEALVSDDFFDTVLASFEYDPNSAVAAQAHRQQNRTPPRTPDVSFSHLDTPDMTDIGRRPSAKEMEVHFPDVKSPPVVSLTPASLSEPSPMKLDGGASRSDSFSHTKSAGLTGGRSGLLRPRHRHFIRQKVAFRQVVPIDDEATIELIHRSFRLQFLRDVLIPRPIDDPLHVTLSSSITTSQQNVIRFLINDEKFWSEFFDVMRQPRTSMRKYARQSMPTNHPANLQGSLSSGDRCSTPRPDDSDVDLDIPQSPCSHVSGANRIWSRHGRPVSPPSPLYPISTSSVQPSGKGKAGILGEELSFDKSASHDGDENNDVENDDTDEQNRLACPPASRSPKDGMFFLREFMNTAKRSFPKDDLVQMVFDHGDPFFDIFEGPLGDPSASAEEVVATLEVLQLVAESHPGLIRDFMLREYDQTGRRRQTNPGHSGSASEEKSGEGRRRRQQSIDSCDRSEASSSIFRVSLRSFDPGEDVRSMADPDNIGEVGVTGGEHGCLIEMFPGRQWFSPWQTRKVSIINPNNGETTSSAGNASLKVEGSTMLQKIIWRLVDDSDSGIQRQAEELLVYLLDVSIYATDNHFSANQTFPEKFLSMFYNEYIDWILLPFTHSDVCLSLDVKPQHVVQYAQRLDSCPNSIASQGANEKNTQEGSDTSPSVDDILGMIGAVGNESQASKASKQSIVNILSLCVRSNTLTSKYMATRHKLVRRVSRLLYYPEKYIKLTAVKFIKTCLSLNDEFYDRHVIDSNVIDSVMFTFAENGITRYNLVNSAIVELLTFISKKLRLSSVCKYLLENYGELIDMVEYADIRDNLERTKCSSETEFESNTSEVAPTKPTVEENERRETIRQRFNTYSKLASQPNVEDSAGNDTTDDTDIFDFDGGGNEEIEVQRDDEAESGQFIPRSEISAPEDSDEDDDDNDEGIHDVLATFGSNKRKRKATSSLAASRQNRKPLKFSASIGSTIKSDAGSEKD